MSHTLIVLIGPTGVGKTELSLSIAEHFNTCIVSSDSRQLYADLKIGTAAPTPEQLARVKHHFVGTLQLTDYYSAAQYEAEVMSKLEELFQKNDVVVLTGGSMMYVDAICKGIDDIPTVDKDTRELMMQKYEMEGLERLCAELKILDPEYYQIVDLKNPKRVIHALEICYMTGKTYTSVNIVGGGSKDLYLNSLTADATGLEVFAGPAEGTAIGNLVVQMITAGEFTDLAAARAAIVR
jgi:tRNA dimethylallyltransferase